MALLIAVSIVGLILAGSELWWRRHVVHGEFSRKFVHITVGSFVAFWPFFLAWREIELLSLAFLIVVGLSKYLHVFRAIHSVQRPTFGELFFAIAVGAVAFATHDKWIYMAALLQMSLADGLAAVVGVRFGNSTSYSIFGQTKSIVGTLTFFIVSTVILGVYGSHIHRMVFSPTLLAISALATVIENVGVEGLDNLLVPLVTAGLLSLYK